MESTGPYFYVSSIVKSNGVLAAFTAYFMQSDQYQSKSKASSRRMFSKSGQDVEMENEYEDNGIQIKSEIKFYNEKGYERNLIVVKPFSIEIYRIDGTDYEPVQSYEIYAKIWNWIKVSIWTVEGREQDMLFIVTDKCECVLLFSKKGTILWSKGYLEAMDYPKIELYNPPLFYFPGETTKTIGALLHRNLLHLIPIVCQNTEYKLTDPITVSIGESNIKDLTAIISDNTRSKLTLAWIEENNILSYQSSSNINNKSSEGNSSVFYTINVYEIEDKNSIENSNKYSPFNRDMTDKFKLIGKYDSDNQLSRVISMPFGGFVSFTSSKIIYFASDNISKPFTTQGIIKDMSNVQCVEFIDTMPDKSTYFSDIFRMVFSTENGNIYLVIFNLK